MSNQIKDKIADICKSYDIADLYVFGSRAAEIAGSVRSGSNLSFDSKSDVDIGVLPADRETWSPEKRVNVSTEFEDLFDAERLDLVLLPEAEPYLALDVTGYCLTDRSPVGRGTVCVCLPGRSPIGRSLVERATCRVVAH